MDIEITYTQQCSCSRGIIGVTGSCEQCFAERTALFWEYFNGKITFPKYMRELRRVGR